MLAAACAAPLVFCLPSISDPYGTSEDSLNAAIWGLGARNVLEGGVRSLRGGLVSPYPGTTGNGVYAHHPPLPVWLMTVPVALGGWEGWSRLFALACVAASLALLFRVLQRSFEPRVALAAVATVALCGFLLEFGKVFTTLTLATPLFLLLLDVTLGAFKDERVPRWTPVVVVLLVLSSWDGVLGAGVLLAVLLSRARAWGPAFAGLAALGFVGWHLIDATGGTDELRWQMFWRAGGSEFTVLQWLGKQARFLWYGVGPLTLALMFVAPIAWRARRTRDVEGSWPVNALLTMALAAVPGILMLLIFRQGAQRHAYWGFNLWLPAAVAIAMALTIAVRGGRKAAALLLTGLAVQAAWCAFEASGHLKRDHASNQVGALVARRFGAAGATVPMFTHYNFHPYVSWYTRTRPDWALTREELHARSWDPAAELLVDSHFTGRLGCGVYPALDATEDGRWVVTRVGDLRTACR